jgi:hypothetical protein
VTEWGGSEIERLREELKEARAKLEELKAETPKAVPEREPRRPKLRLIQGGLVAGVGGWLLGRRAQAVAVLAAAGVGSAAVVLMPHYSRPDDLQVPVQAPATTSPERSRSLPDPRPSLPRSTTSDGPVRVGTQLPVPARPSGAPPKTPDDLVPSTSLPASSVTIPTPVGTVPPSLPPTAALSKPTLPQPTAGTSCKATIVVTICIPTKP